VLFFPGGVARPGSSVPPVGPDGFTVDLDQIDPVGLDVKKPVEPPRVTEKKISSIFFTFTADLPPFPESHAKRGPTNFLTLTDLLRKEPRTVASAGIRRAVPRLSNKRGV
jgi:hypothetical protein